MAWMFLTLSLLGLNPVATTEMQASVRVNHPESSSGTVIHVAALGDGRYTAYVLSTGHMGKRTEPSVEFFYLDGKKLAKPQTAQGRIVFLVENGVSQGVDFCVIEVDAKGKPAAVPIAKKDVGKGVTCLSIGCDMGSLPTAYQCKVVKVKKHQYALERDTPRPGRSGGGLFHDGKLVGVCWGCYQSGNGQGLTGMFTRASTIRRLLASAGYENLLE